MPDETKSLITEYLHPKLKKIFEEQAQNSFIFLLPEKKVFKTDNLVEVTLNDTMIAPQFKIVAEAIILNSSADFKYMVLNSLLQ